MTLDEAIRIIRLSKGELAYETQKEVSQAKKLGIEALKRERECRENAPHEEWLLLPGETEEVTIDNQVKPKSTEVVEN